MNELTRDIDSLLVVATIAALAPFVCALVPGNRLPQVVVLIAGGVLIGPQVLGLVRPATIELFANVGLGFVFLLAGYDLEPHLFRERAGRLALTAWLVALALALTTVGILTATGFVRAFVPVALGLTTTALGILLPILRDHDMLEGAYGRYIVAAGATGEILPITAIAVFLGTTSSFVALLSLAAVGGLAVLFVVVPRAVRSRRLAAVMVAGEHAASQTTLRWSVVLLLALLAFAARFGLDIVLGAFLAGVWDPLESTCRHASLSIL